MGPITQTHDAYRGHKRDSAMRCHRDRQPLEHRNLRELPATVDCRWDKAHIGDSDREESICEECPVRLWRPLSRALLLARVRLVRVKDMCTGPPVVTKTVEEPRITRSPIDVAKESSYVRAWRRHAFVVRRVIWTLTRRRGLGPQPQRLILTLQGRAVQLCQHKRAYGMDQDVYPWSPIITRPVLRWPDNARVALAVIVNLEHWDWEVPPHTPLAVSPLGGPEGLWSGNQPAFPDIGGYGNHEYGNRVGIFRILAVLDKYGIKPTLALDKAVADHYPFLIKEGQRRDAEFIAHGLSRRRIIHIGMSEDEERQYIRDSIAAVEQATGTRPVGWSGPDFQETPHTPDLLAAEGIRYVCDWGNDEQPYQMTPKTGELYALGVNAYLDDNYIHLHGRRTINEVNLLWREWFDGLYADGATTGRVMVLHLHPWIMGQPWRIRHLDEVLGHITAHAGVWKATGSEIIDWFKAQSG